MRKFFGSFPIEFWMTLRLACISAFCLLHLQGFAQIDLCDRLQQSVQGRKHGFLAGNLTYYVGGFHASWEKLEDETLGLTHPFHHDLRSRGVGKLTSSQTGTEHTGTGNDYNGWEFYKDTKVLFGSIVIGDEIHRHPKPARMFWRPDKMICEYEIEGILVREEKFIGSNDAAASLITSSQPITLQFEGKSFFVRESVSSSADSRYDKKNNTILIREGGQVRSQPDPNRPEKIGPCVYQGMTTALSCSKDFSNSIVFSEGDRGQIRYSFQIPCDEGGMTISWAMHDDQELALRAAREIIENDQEMLEAKTAEMNRQLNEEIPQFRCSDQKFEEIYYFLWALYLMYYIDVQKGWEMENHTQTAVNNFLGIHRYDACFQIKVGAWTRDKPKYAYGNVLTWKHLVENNRFLETREGIIMLSDNKGINWHSGAYGTELSEHVLGAWQIYQHTGDKEFLRKCYEGYFRKVFWRKMIGFAMNDEQVGDTLDQIAALTGNASDLEHWSKIVRRDPKHTRLMFEQRWEANGHKNLFMGAGNGMLTTTSFWAMRSPHFPRPFAKSMIHAWALNKKIGFYGEFFPLAMARRSMPSFVSEADLSFGYTPDTAYFTLDGIFQQGFPEIASELTLNHLGNYNYHKSWNIPIAPEAFKRDLTLFGDQYSNFNAGKILLFLEGLAGISYSVPDNLFHIRDSMPKAWEWMEFKVPVGDTEGWTEVRFERKKSIFGGSRKIITVENCPLRVRFEPWLEGNQIYSKPDLNGPSFSELNATFPDYLSFQAQEKSSRASISIPIQ